MESERGHFRTLLGEHHHSYRSFPNAGGRCGAFGTTFPSWSKLVFGDELPIEASKNHYFFPNAILENLKGVCKSTTFHNKRMLAEQFRTVLLFFLMQDCRQYRSALLVSPQVDLPMRNTATKFTRLRKNRGCLVLMAANLIGSGPFLNTLAFAQQNGMDEQLHVRRGQSTPEGTSSREARDAAIQRIPFQQLTQEASTRLRTVVTSSSYFRSMPAETVDCDPEMFTFLVRHPEVIVNIWEVMGVTKVSLQRIGPYQLQGSDGAGTASKMDLVFGSDSMHIYFANGTYQGSLWARELNGKCVVILHNRPAPLPNGKRGIVASMDVFMKLDNLGADLVVKTLGPLMGKTADNNFTECSSFFSQISQTAERNPYGIQQLAKRLTKIDPNIRDQFIATTASVAQRSGNAGSLSIGSQTQPEKVVEPTQIPILSAKPKLPTEDLSTRRQSKLMETPVEERVDSPTILLLGKDSIKEDNAKLKKP